MRYFVITLFRYYVISLFRYYVISLFRYYVIALLRYYVIALFRLTFSGSRLCIGSRGVLISFICIIHSEEEGTTGNR